MNLRLSVSFVFVFALVSCGLASPTLRLRRDVSEENLLPKNVEESLKQITEEVGKSVKHLVDNSQWIYKSLTSIARNMVQEGFQNVASWMVDFMVRLEFLSMADGSHVFFPLSGKSEIEQEYKTVAKAVSKLLFNLKTMERTDMVVKNVTRYLVTKDADPHFQELKAAPEKMLRTFLHMIFETLDHRMEADEELRVEYKQQKTEAKEEVKRDPKMRGPLFKLWEKTHSKQPRQDEILNFLKDQKTFRQSVVNKLFLKQSAKHFMMIFSAQHHRRYLLTRALIQKAHSVSNSDSKINEVYHQGLQRAAELPVDEDDSKISDVLFSSIESALESDPTLNADIQNMMKQIEGSTVYDTDMFYEDFSLL